MQAVVQRLSSAGGARAASSRWLATAARPVARSPLNMPADMAPSKVGPKWRRPRVSRRKAATMRKAALVNGTYGSWDAATGTGWDPAWDPTPMAGVARPPKGRRHEKAKPERIAKIQAALAEMDKKIADYKKSRPARLRKDSVVALLSKKDPWER